MSTGVRCKSCGKSNDLNRMFCIKCGAKLDLSDVKNMMNRQGSGGILARLVRMVVVAGLLGVLGLMVWPMDFTGQAGTPADIRLYEAKRDRVLGAVRSGLPFTQVVTEAEINAYLDSILKGNARAQEPAMFEVRMSSAGFRFTAGQAVFFTEMNRGPIRVTCVLELVPGTGVRGEAMKVVRAQLGHLPLPAWAAALVSKRVAHVFSGMEAEWAILREATEVKVVDGKLAVRAGM